MGKGTARTRGPVAAGSRPWRPRRSRRPGSRRRSSQRRTNGARRSSPTGAAFRRTKTGRAYSRRTRTQWAHAGWTRSADVTASRCSSPGWNSKTIRTDYRFNISESSRGTQTSVTDNAKGPASCRAFFVLCILWMVYRIRFRITPTIPTPINPSVIVVGSGTQFPVNST